MELYPVHTFGAAMNRPNKSGNKALVAQFKRRIQQFCSNLAQTLYGDSTPSTGRPSLNPDKALSETA
jgi:hypothetical protein